MCLVREFYLKELEESPVLICQIYCSAMPPPSGLQPSPGNAAYIRSEPASPPWLTSVRVLASELLATRAALSEHQPDAVDASQGLQALDPDARQRTISAAGAAALISDAHDLKYQLPHLDRFVFTSALSAERPQHDASTRDRANSLIGQKQQPMHEHRGAT
jgi:hypothetical protein